MSGPALAQDPAAADAAAAAAEVDDAQQWTEVFTLFQQSGRDDRGATYAMSMGALRRKGEELDQQLEELKYAEEQLLKKARMEAEGTRAPGSNGPRSASAAANVWGRSVACTMTEKVRHGAVLAEMAEEPWQAAVVADQAHSEALQQLNRQQKEQQEAAERARIEEAAQARAAAEAAAQRAQQLGEAEKAALRTQGMNSRRLPLRPGVPPCGYYLRKGVCKHGRSCLWDHPEPELNSLGCPVRPGQPVCAHFVRTQTCKFGAICGLDHPEPQGQPPQDQGSLPLELAKAEAQQHQLQLYLHLQLVQETSSLQEPDAMSETWVKFRVTFCLPV